MLDLTGFIKEYVEELQRKKEAVISTSNNPSCVCATYNNVRYAQDTEMLPSESNIDTEIKLEVWRDEYHVYEFYFKGDKPYSVNLYDRAKYEKPD